MPCYQWDDATGAQCTHDVFKGGLCKIHYEDSTNDLVTSTLPSAAVKWTPKKIKEAFGAISTERDKTGGEYLVNGPSGQHVHVYNDGGAHVKVGNAKYVFLQKPNWKFNKDNWTQGVSDVKSRNEGSELGRKLLGAMALTLAEKSGLADHEIATLIADLDD
jgi:hypothetical protein